MIKETVTYTDFNGNERKEEHYFHLSDNELTEMELSKDGGLSEYYRKIVASQSQPELIKIFKELILKSYGIKSDDGRGFIKEDKNGHLLCDDFKQTAAYDTLYMELVTDTKKATEFFNGIIPEGRKQVAQQAVQGENNVIAMPTRV